MTIATIAAIARGTPGLCPDHAAWEAWAEWLDVLKPAGEPQFMEWL